MTRDTLTVYRQSDGKAIGTLRPELSYTQALDRQAGLEWQRGNYGEARALIGRAQVADPSQADLWGRRLAAISEREADQEAGA